MNLVKKHLSVTSFIIILLFLIVCFSLLGIKPFGNKLLLLGDSYGQYVPFLSLFKEKTLSDAGYISNFFYTWKVGLGANYLLLFFYYLASPFNIILLLVSKSGIVGAITIIIILKIALSAASFSYYLSKKESFDGKRFAIVVLSVGYALSGFVCGYFWNIMWLDSLIMFPLVMMGLEKLLNGNKPFMYIVTLCFTIYLNFYIAFMICIFLVIYVAFWRYDSVKDFRKKFITFGLSSFLAAGMTAVSLFVTYFGISKTETAGFSAPSFGFFGNIFYVFRNMFFLTKPVVTDRYNGVANIYSGIALLVLFFIYLFSSKIRISEKLRRLGMLFVLVISMNEKVLNYIWHGLHEQFLIPNRFSFVYIFLVLCIGYDALGSLYSKDENEKKATESSSIISLAGAGIAAILFICVCFFFVDLDSWISSTTVVMLNIVVVIVYSIVITIGGYRKRLRNGALIVFSVLFILEVLSNAFYDFSKNAFVKNETALNTIRKYYDDSQSQSDSDKTEFYREEVLNPTVTNESTLLGMNAASTFCSTIYGDSVLTMMDMGFTFLNNQFIYQGYTTFTDSILGVKNQYYTKEGQVYLIENKNAQSLGFTVNNDILSYKPEEEINPPSNLNRMASLMLGEDIILMKDVNAGVIYDYENCNIREGVDSSNSILIQPIGSENADFIMEYDTEEKGFYYIYLAATDADKVTVLLDGKQYIEGKVTNGWLALPELNKGVTVDVVFETSVETSLLWYFSRYDSGKATEILEKLQEKNMNITEINEGTLSADVEVGENEVLFTTIPYDKGWKVYDGSKRVDTVHALRGFTAIKLSPGHHSLRFEYIPEGLVPGLLIMIASWIVFIVFYRRSKGKLVKNLSEHGDEVVEETEEVANHETSEG